LKYPTKNPQLILFTSRFDTINSKFKENRRKREILAGKNIAYK